MLKHQLRQMIHWLLLRYNNLNNCKERSVIMRDATKEEYESVNNYIKSISTETGINFWDLIK